MIPIAGLFESHLNVADLPRAVEFYGQTLGLSLAYESAERRVAFFWLGAPGQSMLGLWETGSTPQRTSLHVAFRVAIEDLLLAPARLRAAGIEPRGFLGEPADEPTVLAWMPAASVYFYDPDGNLLEFLTMLPDDPQPARGVVSWRQWRRGGSD